MSIWTPPNDVKGVLGAVLMVAISMWAWIGVNLHVAFLLFGSAALLPPALARRELARLPWKDPRLGDRATPADFCDKEGGVG